MRLNFCLLDHSSRGVQDPGPVAERTPFVQGFPRMAHLLIDAIRLNQVDLWRIDSLDAYRRLVERRSRTPALIWSVARVFSVFESVSYTHLEGSEDETR